MPSATPAHAERGTPLLEHPNQSNVPYKVLELGEKNGRQGSGKVPGGGRWQVEAYQMLGGREQQRVPLFRVRKLSCTL